MKRILISSVVIVGIFLVFQIYTALATGKTETQPYTIIRLEVGFEIRYYPAATLAMVTSKARSYKELGGSGFGKLAGYIFGGNKENKQIAMTSPVHMEINDSVSTMAFVLPAEFNAHNLPIPGDSSIAIRTAAPEYVAAVQFGGFASDQNISDHVVLLEEMLRKRGLKHHGNFRFLGYNPPYQPFGRRNEVIVTLIKEEVLQH